MIRLSSVIFGSHVSSLMTAKNTLASVSVTKVETSSTSKVIEMYHNQFNELQKLVTNYLALLEADIALIEEVGQELVQTDNSLGLSLSSGLDKEVK